MPLKSKLFVLFSGIWAAFIFSNSFKTGTNSEKMSNPIVKKIVELLGEIGIHWDENVVTLIVRKSAHFCEFMLLGILLTLIFVFINKKLAYYNGTILFLCAIVPVCDEFIQSFIVGRSSEVRDVVLDFCGAFVGFLIVSLVHRTRNHKSNYGKRIHG